MASDKTAHAVTYPRKKSMPISSIALDRTRTTAITSSPARGLVYRSRGRHHLSLPLLLRNETSAAINLFERYYGQVKARIVYSTGLE